MIKKESKKKPLEDPNVSAGRQGKSVRGSGFTYDEDLAQTDQSIPLTEKAPPDIVKLPDLGKPNRP